MSEDSIRSFDKWPPPVDRVQIIMKHIQLRIDQLCVGRHVTDSVLPRKLHEKMKKDGHLISPILVMEDPMIIGLQKELFKLKENSTLVVYRHITNPRKMLCRLEG